MRFLALVACLSRYLDAPYVLTTGLPPITHLESADQVLIAHTARGAFRIDGNGVATAAPDLPAPPATVLTALPAAAGTPLATATDARGRVYVVADRAEPALFRVDGDQLTLIGEWVGPVTDMAFGSGGLLPPENLYLSRSDGVVAYLRPP